jgi:hypothetical protein
MLGKALKLEGLTPLHSFTGGNGIFSVFRRCVSVQVLFYELFARHPPAPKLGIEADIFA